MCEDYAMTSGFAWNEEKNQLLIELRGISFDSIVSSMQLGGLVEVVDHPNQSRYPDQQIYIVEINEYVYLVPFVRQEDGSSFLKTIIPSSRETRRRKRRTK